MNLDNFGETSENKIENITGGNTMNRSEILFIYDAKDINPNGDPLNDNKPRVDEETEINLVTDVRLKRTIRDYLSDFKGYSIFISADENEDGTTQSLKQKLDKEFNITNLKFDSPVEAQNYVKNELFNNYIDVRLFGGVIAPKSFKIKMNKGNSKDFLSFNVTGPVQFRMGRSLHKVEVQHIKGTGAFASNDEKNQNTFRDEYILPYSLISFYGVVNENVAYETGLTENDVTILLDGVWNGTKNLVSHTKIGQTPRVLIQVEYNENNFFIGDLNNRMKINKDISVSDKKIRSVSDVKLDVNEFLYEIITNKDKIFKVNYKIDKSVQFCNEDKPIDLIDELVKNGINVEELDL